VEDFYDRLEDDDEVMKGLVLRKTGEVDIEYLKVGLHSPLLSCCET